MIKDDLDYTDLPVNYEIWALYLDENWMPCEEAEEEIAEFKDAELALKKAKKIFDNAQCYFPKTVLPANCKYVNLVVETVAETSPLNFENLDTIFEQTLEVSDHNE